jgi:predicted MFS family arabinose efflux permease
MIIAPILPQIGAQLAVESHLLGTLVTAYAFAVGIFALIVGPISDRIGRRKILLYGTASMTLSLLLHVFATGYWSFLLIRAITGAAGGILSGSAVSYIGDYFPYEKRGWANGWVMSGAASGQVLGIPLGTILSEKVAFYAPFVLFSITMALTFILIWRYLPQPSVEQRQHKISIKNSVSDYWVMLKRPEIGSASLAYMVMFLSISMFIVYLPSWLTYQFRVTSEDIALMFFVGGIANVMTGPNAGRFSDVVGRKKLILLSCSGTALIMGISTFVIQEFYIVYFLFFITMMLVAMRISPFQALLSEIVSGNNRGSLMSLTVSLGQLGFGIGGAFAGVVYSKVNYFTCTIIGAFFILSAGLIIWKFVPEPELKPKPTKTLVS